MKIALTAIIAFSLGLTIGIIGTAKQVDSDCREHGMAAANGKVYKCEAINE